MVLTRALASLLADSFSWHAPTVWSATAGQSVITRCKRKVTSEGKRGSGGFTVKRNTT